MIKLRLTTGDLWDTETNQAVDNSCHPKREPDDRRRSAGYIEQFRERLSRGRAIRLKCCACMGGDGERMPLGAIAQAIDECGSCMCPLWPFRFGHDPWRPEMSEEQREASRVRFEKFRPPVKTTSEGRKECDGVQSRQLDTSEAPDAILDAPPQEPQP